jgi:hypothetical protein
MRSECSGSGEWSTGSRHIAASDTRAPSSAWGWTSGIDAAAGPSIKTALGSGSEQVAPLAGTVVRQPATRQNQRPSSAQPTPRRRSNNRQLPDVPFGHRTRRWHARRRATQIDLLSDRPGDDDWACWFVAASSPNRRRSVDCGLGGEAPICRHEISQGTITSRAA